MLKYLALLLHLAALPAAAAAPQALFYLSTEAKSVQSFLAHAGQVDVVAPHWYGVDSKGVLTGEPNPDVMAAARKHGVRVTPLVTNHGFVQEDVHELLMHPETHPALFSALVRTAKQHGYAGFQLDLEHVPSADRDALTAFVRGAAKALHAENLLVSIATVPNASIMPKETGYAAWHYANWGGAFDLKALAEVVDMLCLMTYDQHTFTTMPGPVAGMPWVTAQLDAALKLVPREKLALGIPVYGYHWFASTPADGGARQFDKPSLNAAFIDAADVHKLAKTYKGRFAWDEYDRAASMVFYRDNVREWVYYTDGRTFGERYGLVKRQRLAGFASWVLGSEDPAIWKLLPSRKRP